MHGVDGFQIPPRDPVKLSNRTPFSGLTVVNNSPAVAEDFSLSGSREGVVVADVEENSNAAYAGLQKGDVILGLNTTKITSTKTMERTTSTRADYWQITIERAGQMIRTELGG